MGNPKNAALVLTLVGLFASVTADNNEQECKFWKQLASNLTNANQPMSMPVQMNINCKGGCANITCNGNLQVSGLFGLDKTDMTFCFGLQLNHCEDPVHMQYYILLPNVTNSGNITHNTTYELPDLGLSLPGNPKLVVFVEMVKVNQSFVDFGLTARALVMKAPVPIPLFERPIIRHSLIDIPNCPKNKKDLLNFKPPQTCEAPTKPTTVPTKAPFIKSSTYHTSCEFGLAQCINRNEMCKAKGDYSKNGLCECIPSAELSPKTGYCESTSGATTLKPLITTGREPSVTEKSTGGKKSHLIPIIVGSVVGVVVIGIVGVLIIILIGRRKRTARYRDRQQLLSDDMMDEEDDPNITM